MVEPVTTPAAKKQRGRLKSNQKTEAAVSAAVALQTEEDEEEDGIPNFRCPRHYCETCSGEYEQSSKGGVLYPCVRCVQLQRAALYTSSLCPCALRYTDARGHFTSTVFI